MAKYFYMQLFCHKKYFSFIWQECTSLKKKVHGILHCMLQERKSAAIVLFSSSISRLRRFISCTFASSSGSAVVLIVSGIAHRKAQHPTQYFEPFSETSAVKVVLASGFGT